MIDQIHEDVFQEPDQVPRGLLLRIAVGTLAVGLSLCIVAYLLLRAREHTLGGSLALSGRALPPPHRVAEVRQELFTITAPKPTVLEEQRRAVETYGWVNRARGVVRVPIEVGMDLVLGEGRAGKGHP
ncbi:MAG TPA: hypothetical protein VHH90_08690 [Polyangia bacterium]|nr:hypothetical protein [Polyangia bacterium]